GLAQVDDVIAIDDAQGGGLTEVSRERVQTRLDGPGQTVGAQVRLPQAEDLRRQPELAAVAGGVARVAQGHQKASGRGAAEPQVCGERARRVAGHPVAERLDHREAPYQTLDDVGPGSFHGAIIAQLPFYRPRGTMPPCR